MIELKDCVVYRARRKTIAADVDVFGRVVIRCPYQLRDEELILFLAKKRLRLEAERRKWKASPKAIFSIGENGWIPYLGNMIRLKYHNERAIRFEGTEPEAEETEKASLFQKREDMVLYLPSPMFRTRDLCLISRRDDSMREPEERRQNGEMLMKWYAGRTRELLAPRTHAFAGRMGLECPRIKTSVVRGYYGCYNRRYDSITYNAFLTAAGWYEIDGVIVHELSHMRVLNHSKAFYEEMDRWIPDRKERDAALKKNVAWTLEYLYYPTNDNIPSNRYEKENRRNDSE